jgi:hypothetical protein
MDAAAAAAANVNAAPQHVAISWLAVTTLFMTGMFLGHRAFCHPSITVDEATNLLRAAQKSITVTRYYPTTVIQAPTRTVTYTITSTSYFPWSRAAELGPKLRQLVGDLPWDTIDRILQCYIAFVMVYLVFHFWSNLRGRNPIRRLAVATRSRQERIRKRPERLGSWSISTDDVLDLPY